MSVCGSRFSGWRVALVETGSYSLVGVSRLSSKSLLGKIRHPRDTLRTHFLKLWIVSLTNRRHSEKKRGPVLLKVFCFSLTEKMLSEIR